MMLNSYQSGMHEDLPINKMLFNEEESSLYQFFIIFFKKPETVGFW